MATLERAIEIAVQAHKGVTDKAGQPYILHPLRLMFAVTTEMEKTVAILHDVVEDSKPPARWSLDDLRREGFREDVISAVDCVTRREGETWEAFIERIKPNATARAVKLADLTDNMNIRRMNELQEKDLKRLSRYHAAWKILSFEPGLPRVGN